MKLNVADVRREIARGARKEAALVVLQGAESEIGTHILLDRDVTLGRDPTVELTLVDEGISRRHCQVRKDQDTFIVEDLGSTNGTLLNGELLDSPQILKAGDRIYLGPCVIKFTDSDALEVRYHQQMDHLVGTDDLTGLIAKRRFDAAYSRAVDTARSMKRPLSVLMLDLDQLKQINDTHGHPIGAHTISEVGRIIGRVLSPEGAACRFGGDEFAAFLAGRAKPAAIELADEVRRSLAEHRIEKDGVIVRATLSIGVATFPEDGANAELLLRRADEALYRAKRAGRDRVHA
jgi:diguanylate cyclase (GGDEF)-like protein